MNGFDAEKIAEHGEVWDIGGELYRIVVRRDGSKVAAPLDGGPERSVASNQRARKPRTCRECPAVATTLLVDNGFEPVCREHMPEGIWQTTPEDSERAMNESIAAYYRASDAAASNPKLGGAPISFDHLRAATGLVKGPLPLTLDSTVREVEEALGGLPVTLRDVTSTWGDQSPEGWEASCALTGQDAWGHKVVTRRLSALAPTALEALVALANAVRKGRC